MRSRAIGLAAVVVLGGLAARFALADPVPAVFPVTITAATLAPSTRPYRFTFALHDTAVGGTRLWSESKSYVLPATKRISHQLGSVNPAGNPISPLLFDRQLWVEASVGTKRFPRVKLGVVPYAVRSELARNIEGQLTAGQVDATGAAAGDVLTANGDGGAAWKVPAMGGGDITAVLTPPGSGLKGGAETGEASLSLDTGVVQARVADTCAPGSSIRVISADGTVGCEPDDVNGPHVHGGADIASGTVATARLSVGTAEGTVAAGDHAHAGAYIAATNGAAAGKLTVTQGGIREAGEFTVTNTESTSPALLAVTYGSGPALEALTDGAGPVGRLTNNNPDNPSPALVVQTAGKGDAGEFHGSVQVTGPVTAQRFIGDGSSLINIPEADPTVNALAKAVLSCSVGQVAVATATGWQCGRMCVFGTTDCNGSMNDGCEVNMATDANNCGGCGVVCSGNNMAARTCSNALCNGTCNAGFADCNANKQPDGCETNIQTNPNGCGSCGVVCSGNNLASRTCAAGVCNGTCSAGFADCNANKQVDGCEVQVQTDPNNCGGCSFVCSSLNMATRTCGGGVCNGTCGAGYGDCNSNKLADGCETNLSADRFNCGGCGIVCGGLQVCVGGACQ